MYKIDVAQDCFIRECIDEAPDWVAERSKLAMRKALEKHQRQHRGMDFPQINAMRADPLGSWKKLAYAMWNGDPFSLKAGFLPYCEPEKFRKGAGWWGGKPTF